MKQKQQKQKKTVGQSKSLEVPTKEQWGDYTSDLDSKHSYSVFGGRTNRRHAKVLAREPDRND
jgi:FKBP-type peptidyl-prolyl cis-trans isomerase 2